MTRSNGEAYEGHPAALQMKLELATELQVNDVHVEALAPTARQRGVELGPLTGVAERQKSILLDPVAEHHAIAHPCVE